MSDSVRQHREDAPTGLAVAVLTMSDTRTLAEDTSGALICQLLEDAGHSVTEREIVPDEPERIAATVRRWGLEPTIEAVITNGGTGIAPKDRTHDTILGLLDMKLEGFGELFRMLSYEEIGPAAMLSRALAGAIGETPVFALPGSSNAVKLGMNRLILPEIGHIVYELRKRP